MARRGFGNDRPRPRVAHVIQEITILVLVAYSYNYYHKMTEYDKLTVVKLREELVKRGLPKTGLKAALIQRLAESDVQAEQASSVVPADQENEQRSAEEPLVTVDPTDHGEPPPTTAVSDQHHVPRESNTPLHAKSKESTPQDLAAGADAETVNDVEAGDESKSLGPGKWPVDAPSEAEAQLQSQDDQDSSAIPKSGDVGESAPIPTQESADIPREDAPSTATRLEAEAASQDPPALSTQDSVIDGAELREDRNKRKRRSQSPPPSSIETAQKRAKADDGRPLVKLPEDETSVDRLEQPLTTIKDAAMEDVPTNVRPEGTEEDKQTNGLPKQDTDKLADEPSSARTGADTVKRSPSRLITPDVGPAKPFQEDEDLAQPPSATMQKASPTDTRFKNLFTGPSKQESSPTRPLPPTDNEDRVVAPALHPATSALYIRDFMRPLNPGNLKDYLIALASPPDTDPDPAIITEFFLDSIRTHCLVGLTNTSAASRVRSGLHDRVWPDEKTRKPLWVDFVPEEKLKTWINVESDAAGDRRQGMKKWEVVYEEEKGGVMAYLQEAGPNSVAPRTVQPRADSGTAVQAPHGPRGRASDGRAGGAGPAATPEGGKAFGALDDLFPSTTAKPKLYYLPVPRDVANRRLDRLADGRGGGRGDEMRRYTFEEATLVDKGPEYGARARGGYGGRSGGYGAHSSRGGSYRGDTWRGRR
ncbi:MAG: hypothetical protein Q9191_004620 [Dirinaria sp. TL-2023a]